MPRITELRRPQVNGSATRSEDTSGNWTKLNQREMATILAALRDWQRGGSSEPADSVFKRKAAVSDNGFLTDAELAALCELFDLSASGALYIDEDDIAICLDCGGDSNEDGECTSCGAVWKFDSD